MLIELKSVVISMHILGNAPRSSPPSDQADEPLFESLLEKSREALTLILAKGCDMASGDVVTNCSLGSYFLFLKLTAGIDFI